MDNFRFSFGLCGIVIFVNRFIVDANIILGYLNKKDKHHQKCLKFFDDLKTLYKNGAQSQCVIPLHLEIEVNININKRKQNNDWEGIETRKFIGIKPYPIDGNLLQHIHREKLYEKFSVLKPADAIYAIIAYLENIPLVTLDKDFDKVKNIINIKSI